MQEWYGWGDGSPSVAILITTYNRRDILFQTITRLEAYIRYPGNIGITIADDGSDDGTLEMLQERFPLHTVIRSNRIGLGGNANAGLRHVLFHADIVMQLQDDMWLKHELDLTPYALRLHNTPDAGYIRLWGVGGHRYRADLDEQFWRIRWNSPELYIASDRPHIKHRRFHERYGFYPEGRTTAETEEAWCHQTKNAGYADPHPLYVEIPLMLDTERSFEHAGWGCRWRDKGL